MTVNNSLESNQFCAVLKRQLCTKANTVFTVNEWDNKRLDCWKQWNDFLFEIATNDCQVPNNCGLKNSWYCIDMKKYKVGLTAYTLKSRQGDSNNDPIKWIVEGSDDNSTWKELDNRKSDVLRRSNAVHTFELEKTEEIVAYKYIRFRQPGHNCGDNDYFNLANIELFGRLYEPTEE